MAVKVGQGITWFLGWWLQNLRDCLPTSLARKVQKADTHARVLIGQKDAFLSVDGSGWVPCGPEVAEGMSPPRHGSRAEVLVSDDATLQHTMVMPRAVLNDLNGAIAFQVKQFVPLDPSAVTLGYSVSDEDQARATVEVTIAAVRVETVERALAVLKVHGYIPERFETASGGISLAPSQLLRSSQIRRLAIIGLIGLFVVQLLVLPIIDARRIRSSNELLKNELNALVSKTKSAADIKRSVDQRASDAAFLNAQLNQDVLADGIAILSAHAPLDISLSEIQFDGRTFRVSGIAADPAAWALNLQQGGLFESVRLEGVSGRGARDGGRFQMSLRLKGKGDAK